MHCILKEPQILKAQSHDVLSGLLNANGKAEPFATETEDLDVSDKPDVKRTAQLRP